MRWLRLLFLLFVVPLVYGQDAHKSALKTDAQQDGLSGPVRSVRMLSDWNYNARVFTLVPVILCRVCDYDRQGDRTRFGLFTGDSGNRKFAGSDIAIIPDSAGQVAERIVTESGTGKLVSHDWFGPFGQTKSLLFTDGKPSGSKDLTYDSEGHMTELVGRDTDGKIVDQMTTTFNNQGQWIYRADFGRDGVLRWWETYDPASGTQHYQQFDESNAVATEWIVAHNQMLSYWSTTEIPGINEGMRTEYSPGNDVYQFRCQKDGECQTFRIHYEYLNGDYNLPTAVERRDASGTLSDAAYVEYQVDEHRNWTTRRVWVVSPELPGRTLYEVDARAITYWPN